LRIGEWVIPGNILFKQRGTDWFPGENCKMGRDHCIYAVESGYVRYYRDPEKHPKRQYIGIVFDKAATLPYPQNAARKRKLNMLAVRREPEVATIEDQVVVADLQVGDGTGSVTSIRDTPRDDHVLRGKKGYAFRESNWMIGRAGDRSDVQVKKFVPGDRWTAWQRSKARKETNAEKRKLRNAQKASKPKRKKA
jgi:ribosomal protein L27